MNYTRLCFGVVIFLLLCSSPPALRAHSVSIYAWVEGERVFTESFFAGGSRAAHSQIAVFDKGGNKLLTGKTDDHGMFSFRLPQKEELRIVLRTPEGHRAEFNLSVEEKPMSEGRHHVGHTEAPLPVEGLPCLTEEEIRTLVERALDEKLGPIKERLAASKKWGPGITEILGGIGYIFGLMGVAIYFSHRKKAQTKG